MSLRLVPIHLDDANAFVRDVHRHSSPVLRARWCAAAAIGDRIAGVGIAGRPKGPGLQDGWTQEVVRVATDGTFNACSKLYGAAWRGIQALGYTRAITYTLDNEEETGASLRASGWTLDAHLPARKGWDTPSRPRDDESYLTSPRLRWRKGESPAFPVPSYSSPLAAPVPPSLFEQTALEPQS